MTISQQRTPAAGTQNEPVTTSEARTAGNTRWGVWALAIAFGGLGWSVLSAVVPKLGWLSGLAVLAGALAYAMMATNLFLAIRRPVLEKLFGPLDRVYHAHRLIGTGIVAVLGLHLVLIPIASLADRGQSILAHLTVALPLGVTGALLLVTSIILAVDTKVPYGKWQKVHLATPTRGMPTPGTQPGAQVEPVLAARDARDVPCWDELSALAGTMPGLTLTPAFSDLGGRLDSDAIDQLAARKPAGTAWYLCGPSGLADMVQRTLQRRTPASSQVHRELYEWRPSPSKKTRETTGAAAGATAGGHRRPALATTGSATPPSPAQPSSTQSPGRRTAGRRKVKPS